MNKTNKVSKNSKNTSMKIDENDNDDDKIVIDISEESDNASESDFDNESVYASDDQKSDSNNDEDKSYSEVDDDNSDYEDDDDNSDSEDDDQGNKYYKLSDNLTAFIGKQYANCIDILKFIIGYVENNNLINKLNSNILVFDAKMENTFGVKNCARKDIFKLIKPHLVKEVSEEFVDSLSKKKISKPKKNSKQNKTNSDDEDISDFENKSKKSTKKSNTESDNEDEKISNDIKSKKSSKKSKIKSDNEEVKNTKSKKTSNKSKVEFIDEDTNEVNSKQSKKSETISKIKSKKIVKEKIEKPKKVEKIKKLKMIDIYDKNNTIISNNNCHTFLLKLLNYYIREESYIKRMYNNKSISPKTMYKFYYINKSDDNDDDSINENKFDKLSYNNKIVFKSILNDIDTFIVMNSIKCIVNNDYSFFNLPINSNINFKDYFKSFDIDKINNYDLNEWVKLLSSFSDDDKNKQYASQNMRSFNEPLDNSLKYTITNFYNKIKI